MSLGKNIRFYRRERDMTQKDLAAQLGTTQIQISRYENDVICPRPVKLPKLAAILGCTIDDLMKEE